MSSEPTVADLAGILEHAAVAVLEASSRREAYDAVARVLRSALGGRVSLVVSEVSGSKISGSRLSGPKSSESTHQIVAVQGELALVPPPGAVWCGGLGLEALGPIDQARPTRVPCALLTGSLFARPMQGDVVLLPLDTCVGLVVVDAGEVVARETAAALVVVLRLALQEQRAREEVLDHEHTAACLVAMHRALDAGALEETFSRFAGLLSQLVRMSSVFVAVTSAGTDSDALEVLVAHGPRALPPGSRLPGADLRRTSAPQLSDIHRRGLELLGGDDAQALVPGAERVFVMPLGGDDALLGALVLVDDDASRSPHGLHAPLGLPTRLEALLEPIAQVLVSALKRRAREARSIAGSIAGSRAKQPVRDWLSLLDVVDAMVALVDREGIVRCANYPFARHFGLELEAVVGCRLVDFLPGALTVAQLATNGPTRARWLGPSGEPLCVSIQGLADGEAVLTMIEATRAQASIPPPGPLPSLSRRPSAPRGRLLVVDDEPSILRAVSRTLSRAYDVVTAGDGDEALDLLRTEHHAFDVVMTDVQMSRIGGIELYHTLQGEAPSLCERVVFMTGGFFGPEIEAFLRAMQGRVVRKPFDPEALRRVIDARVTTCNVA